MSATNILSGLHQFWRVRNDKMRVIHLRIEGEFSYCLPDVRATMIQTEKGKAKVENLTRLCEFRDKITSGKVKDTLSIAKAKQPNLTSKDGAEKAIGEAQVQNAFSFLQTHPTGERVLSAIRDALVTGRIDYATTLMDNALNDVSRDISGQATPTDAQKQLEVELATLWETFPGRAEIEEAQSDLQALEKAEKIVKDLTAQEEAGKEYLLSPELFPVLTEDERQDAVLHAQGGSFVETVALRRRISEAMSEAGA
jgi:hypothetical protein